MKVNEVKTLINEIQNIIGFDNETLEGFEGEYVKIDIDDMRAINSLLAHIDMTLSM